MKEGRLTPLIVLAALLCLAATTFKITWPVADATLAGMGLESSSSAISPTTTIWAGPNKSQRVTTGSVGATTFVNVDLSWTIAFADANYTASCSVVDATSAAQGLNIDHIQQILAAKVTLVIHNPTGGALTGTIHCWAKHD